MFNFFKKQEDHSEKYKKQLQVLERVSNILISGSSLDSSLEEITQSIPKVMRVSIVAILLWDEKKGQLVLSKISMPKIVQSFVESTTGQKINEIIYPTSDENSPFTKAIKENTIQYELDVTSLLYPLMDKQRAEILMGLVANQFKGAVVAPFSVNGKVIGVLTLGWKNSTLTEEDRGIIATFANQASIGIYNTSLFEENKKQLLITSERNKRLQSLNTLTNKIITNLDPKSVVQEALDEIPELFGYLGAIYSTYDKKTGIVHIRSFSRNELSKKAFEMIGMDPSTITMNINDEKTEGNISREAILEDKVVFTNRFHNLSRGVVNDFIADRVQDLLQMTAIVTLPVKLKGEITGVLNFILAKQSIEKIKKEEIETIKIISNQISVALENASLYMQVGEALEQLKVSNQQLQEKYQFEKDMMGIMGHELRTPMTVARGMSELLISKVDKDVAQEVGYFKDKLEKIHMSVMKESELIQTMLSTSHIDNNKMNFQFMEFDFLDVVDYSVMAFKQDAALKKLDFIYEKPADKLPAIFSDQNRVQEVVNNLISNAIKYTNQGSVKVYMELKSEAIYFNVKDTGIGIPEKEMVNIGKKFYRIHQQTADNKKLSGASGTGLGLYVVKGILEALGGELSVQSVEGKGSTFTAIIPLRSKEAEAAEKPVEHKGDMFSQMGLK